MTITVRNSSITYVNNAASATIALPTGSAAGDRCFLFAAHGFGVTTPTDWTPLDNESGSNTNGGVFEKVLTANDITAGSVKLTFGGTYYGIIAIISFVGSYGVETGTVYSRNTAGAATRALATAAGPQIGDYALYFGSARANGAVTSSAGSALQSSTNVNYSGVLTGGILAAAGAVSSTFSFATVGADYDAIVVFSPTTALDTITKAGVVAALHPPAADIITKADVVAALHPPTGLIIPKAGVVAVLRPKVLVDSTRRRQGMVPIF